MTPACETCTTTGRQSCPEHRDVPMYDAWARIWRGACGHMWDTKTTDVGCPVCKELAAVRTELGEADARDQQLRVVLDTRGLGLLSPLAGVRFMAEQIAKLQAELREEQQARAAAQALIAEYEPRTAKMRAALERNRQGLRNILEFRKLDSEKWGARDGYGGRYGALTREEIEEAIAGIDAALSVVPGEAHQSAPADAATGPQAAATTSQAEPPPNCARPIGDLADSQQPDVFFSFRLSDGGSVHILPYQVMWMWNEEQERNAEIAKYKAERTDLLAQIERGRKGLLATLEAFGCAAPVEVTEGLFVK